MNRPKASEDLEAYCDELEKVNERFGKAITNINNSFYDDIKRLEKALDKACDILSNCVKSCDPYNCPLVDKCNDNDVRSIWKKELLKDE